MKNEKKLDLSAIKDLRDGFNNLKEKIANTVEEKRELLQAKCEAGLTKVSDFAKIHRDTAINTVKVLGISTVLLLAVAPHYRLAFGDDGYKISNDASAQQAVTAEAEQYHLTHVDDIITVKKDYFEASSDAKNNIEVLKGLMECANRFQSRGRSDTRTTSRSELQNKTEAMDEFSKRLKQINKNKSQKDINEELKSEKQSNERQLDSGNNRDMDISIIKEIEEDNTVKFEKKDIDGDGIEDYVCTVEVRDFSDKPYNAVFYTKEDDDKKEKDSEEYII